MTDEIRQTAAVLPAPRHLRKRRLRAEIPASQMLGATAKAASSQQSGRRAKPMGVRSLQWLNRSRDRRRKLSTMTTLSQLKRQRCSVNGELPWQS